MSSLVPVSPRRRRIPGRGALAAAAAACLLTAVPAAAETLEDALAIAYQTNPQLAAQREALLSTNERVPQALAGLRPFASATGSIGAEYQDTTPGGDDTLNPSSIGVAVSQPIYRGGRTSADIDEAEAAVQAGRAALFDTEQVVLLDVATAYMNVLRDQAVLELQINNEQVLQRQLQATQDRFAVGEVTRTDVSQAESRLAGATAGRIEAEGLLRVSRANYIRVVGQAPGSLEAPPPLGPLLPATLDETVALAESHNPAVVASIFNERAAQAAVRSVRGELLPEVRVVGQVQRLEEPSRFTDNSTDASITAEVTVPLYQSGAVYSRVREARYIAEQRRIEVEDARRAAVEAAIAAWEELTTARATIESRRAQVTAAEIALDGVNQEALVGARTVLDVLDAEQELLDARVALVRAQRDEVVASFRVLSAVGRLTAPELNLPVDYYDIDRAYNATRARWWGTSVISE
jgi:outer membrane protein/adhesin transport system outer membrane protein